VLFQPEQTMLGEFRVPRDFGKRGKQYFFFEKKKQKTFVRWLRGGLIGTYLNRQKFFGSFFQKRTAFLLTAAPTLRARSGGGIGLRGRGWGSGGLAA
jgi:hypothetical protein